MVTLQVDNERKTVGSKFSCHSLLGLLNLEYLSLGGVFLSQGDVSGCPHTENPLRRGGGEDLGWVLERMRGDVLKVKRKLSVGVP